MSVDPRARPLRPSPARGASRPVHRPRREAPPARGVTDRGGPREQPSGATDAGAGLAATVHRVLGLLQEARGTIDSEVVQAALLQLRHFAHDASDPAVRATVHVACAHLSAGDLEETHFALSTAAQTLRA